jgi:hypothetical protein
MTSVADTGESADGKTSPGKLYSQLRNAVIDVYASVIGPTALTVYCVLLRRAGQSSSAYPSRRDIGVLVGVSKDAVDSALKRLTGEDGTLAAYDLKPLIRKEYRFSDHGDNTSSRYHIEKTISMLKLEDAPRRRKQRSDFGTKRPKKTDHL